MDTKVRPEVGAGSVPPLDLSAVSLDQAHWQGDSALAHLVRQVTAEADTSEPPPAVFWNSALA